MDNIKFKTRRVTIISADTVLNRQYDEPFNELHLCFDKGEYNWEFSFEETKSVASDINMINNLHKLLKCKENSEMNGRKIRVFLYKRKNIFGEWIKGWEIAGYGAYNSDRFMDVIYDGPIMSRAELERIVEKRECVY
ncbi:MAG: hypothetical protein K2H53_05530 [Clostridia bacterium]|nr:hypothetical protein [Clostridia bacterium]